jgi:hypothetical protein
VDVLLALVINPSFLRKQESRRIARQWILAFAGMTVTNS